jgi:signal transduction histidine kinase
LNVSKISAGSLELKMDIFNIENFIKESIQTFLSGNARKDISIVGNANFNISADKFRMEQVLINLISNAFKYSPEGSPIEIAVEILGSMVKISIRDEGSG